MKKPNIFPFIVASVTFCFTLLVTSQPSQAQGRGHHKHGHKKHHKHEHYEQGHGHHGPGLGHHKHRHGHHCCTEVRYVYYKKHRVYYDRKKHVYISIRKGDWEVSAKIPTTLRNVKMNTALAVDLDYQGDEIRDYHYNRER
ncbi:hypothetical protein AAG747_06255 [Rapidithrix thailandica]|uniref:Uncharacterized protein n=1 Tax=Rapidithrix thailandica TaxID=413964 RepID=A0AAW9S4Z5_9BACT